MYFGLVFGSLYTLHSPSYQRKVIRLNLAHNYMLAWLPTIPKIHSIFGRERLEALGRNVERFLLAPLQKREVIGSPYYKIWDSYSCFDCTKISKKNYN